MAVKRKNGLKKKQRHKINVIAKHIGYRASEKKKTETVAQKNNMKIIIHRLQELNCKNDFRSSKHCSIISISN